jgi:hypothetical protein
MEGLLNFFPFMKFETLRLFHNSAPMFFMLSCYSPLKRRERGRRLYVQDRTRGGQSMKATTVLIGLLLLMGGSAYGDQAAPRGAEGSQIRQGGGSELNVQGRPRFGPPPEAYAACEGKKAGDAAHFVDPRGETVKGTCEQEGDRLVLRPDRSRVNSDGRARNAPVDKSE